MTSTNPSPRHERTAAPSGAHDEASHAAPDAVPGAAQTPASTDDPDTAADMVPLVPMLEEPTHLPGVRRAKFSPLMFYALSHVGQLHVDPTAEGLWLVEEPCPKISAIGFTFYGREFTHERIQEFVSGLPGDRSGRFLIRYNRALLARGVLREVLLCERDAGGHVHVRLRCRPREQVIEEMDLTVVLRERERYAAILLSKVANAHEQRITLAAGTAALERMRDEQAARAQRQSRTKRDPMVAKPIRARNRSEAAALEADRKAAALAAHLSGGEMVDRFDEADSPLVDASEPPAIKDERQPKRAGMTKPAGGSNEERDRAETPPAGAQREGQGESSSPAKAARGKTSRKRRERLGTQTGRGFSEGIGPSDPTGPSMVVHDAHVTPLLDALGGRLGIFTADDN